jgi:hypothetical protein
MAAGVPWNKFYFGSLVLSAVNLCFILFAFRPTQTELLRERTPPTDSTRASVRGSATREDMEIGLDSPTSGTMDKFESSQGSVSRPGNNGESNYIMEVP